MQFSAMTKCICNISKRVEEFYKANQVAEGIMIVVVLSVFVGKNFPCHINS